MNKRILLDFNEKAYNDLAKRQEEAGTAIKPLVEYCEKTLEIEIVDLEHFFKEPKAYCIDAYWKKYGQQFQNTPVKKEKVIALTGWSDIAADMHIKKAKNAFSILAPHHYEFKGNEIGFKRDPESFKTYVKEKDRAMYDLVLEFIAMANKMEKLGGKPAWTLAKFHDALAAPGNELIPSKIFFTSGKTDLSRFF